MAGTAPPDGLDLLGGRDLLVGICDLGRTCARVPRAWRGLLVRHAALIIGATSEGTAARQAWLSGVAEVVGRSETELWRAELVRASRGIRVEEIVGAQRIEDLGLSQWTIDLLAAQSPDAMRFALARAPRTGTLSRKIVAKRLDEFVQAERLADAKPTGLP